MTDTLPRTMLQLRSLIRPGELELSLAEVPTPEPADDEVLVRMQASPMNPSDLGLLFGTADIGTARAAGSAARPVITATVPEKLMKAMAGRPNPAMACLLYPSYACVEPTRSDVCGTRCPQPTNITY